MSFGNKDKAFKCVWDVHSRKMVKVHRTKGREWEIGDVALRGCKDEGRTES